MAEFIRSTNALIDNSLILRKLIDYIQGRSIPFPPNKWPCELKVLFDLPSDYGFCGSYLVLSTNGLLVSSAHLSIE